jgi:excinuclease ABC subunit A
MNIADISRLPLKQLDQLFHPYLGEKNEVTKTHPEQAIVIRRIVEDMLARMGMLLDLGFGLPHA